MKPYPRFRSAALALLVGLSVAPAVAFAQAQPATGAYEPHVGQPGKDVFIGNGGGDTIDARDGNRDASIECGRGTWPPPRSSGKRGSSKGGANSNRRSAPSLRAKGGSLALIYSFDPAPLGCAEVNYGHPVPGLPH